MKIESRDEANDESHDEDLEIHEYNEDDEIILKTHELINRELNGEIQKMDKGYVELRLTTTAEMVADDQEMIHGGFLFSAADFAAMAAVNEKMWFLLDVILSSCLL